MLVGSALSDTYILSLSKFIVLRLYLFIFHKFQWLGTCGPKRNELIKCNTFYDLQAIGIWLRFRQVLNIHFR